MRRLAAMSVMFFALLGLAAPAWSQPAADSENQIVLSGDVNVREGERLRRVVVFNGDVTVDGEVRESVTVFNGSVTVAGRVGDAILVFNGPVSIRDGARVGGDVVSRNAPNVAPGARVEGEIRRVQPTASPGGLRFLGRLPVWLAYSVSTLILGMLLLGLAPRAMERAFDTARSATGPVIGAGLLMLFGLPLLALLALVTLVGIPLGVGLLFALFLIYMLGYTVGAWVLGRSLIRPPRGRFVAFLAGWAILRAAALIPFVGGLLWLAAVVVGLGALLVALWRARAPAPEPAAPASAGAIAATG